MYSVAETLAAIRFIRDQIRDTVIEATEEFQTESLARVVEDGDGNTIYVIDRISEDLLVTLFERKINSLLSKLCYNSSLKMSQTRYEVFEHL